MWKKVVKVIGVILFGWIAYGGYNHYRAGFHTAPAIEADDFLLSYKSGFRAVMRGFGKKDKDRKYLGFPSANVPSWYQDTWSICRPPTSEETLSLEGQIEIGPGGRLDAICEIDADGDVFVRGLVASVPRL